MFHWLVGKLVRRQREAGSHELKKDFVQATLAEMELLFKSAETMKVEAIREWIGTLRSINCTINDIVSQRVEERFAKECCDVEGKDRQKALIVAEQLINELSRYERGYRLRFEERVLAEALMPWIRRKLMRERIAEKEPARVEPLPENAMNVAFSDGKQAVLVRLSEIGHAVDTMLFADEERAKNYCAWRWNVPYYDWQNYLTNPDAKGCLVLNGERMSCVGWKYERDDYESLFIHLESSVTEFSQQESVEA